MPNIAMVNTYILYENEYMHDVTAIFLCFCDKTSTVEGNRSHVEVEKDEYSLSL